MRYDINVYRDGRWWMVEIPALDGLTQARRVGEVEEMARSYIAATLDVPLSEVEVEVSSVKVGEVDALAIAEHVRELRAKADAAEADAVEAMRTAVGTLVTVAPVRDVGELLGVSHQRVSQVAKP